MTKAKQTERHLVGHPREYLFFILECVEADQQPVLNKFPKEKLVRVVGGDAG